MRIITITKSSKRALRRFHYIVKMVGIHDAISFLSNTKDKGPDPENHKGVIYRINEQAVQSDYPRLLAIEYELSTGKPLDWNNILTFNEKIQWMKLYDSSAIKTRLVDKLLVRDWVSETIGEQYLIPIYGAYDSFDDIPFENLPDQFVLKCNHGSGWNMIVTDKNALNLKQAKQLFDYWMGLNFAFFALELQYKEVKPKIVIEQYLGNIDERFTEYHIYCFVGTAKYIEVLTGGKHHRTATFVDRDWKKSHIQNPSFTSGDNTSVPGNYKKILSIADSLSESFAFVRVDLYSDNSDIILFGEMTFTPRKGYGRYIPESVDRMFGDLITLHEKANQEEA